MKSYITLMLTLMLLVAVVADNAYSVRYPSSGAPLYQFRFQPISGYASYVYLPTSSNPSSYGGRRNGYYQQKSVPHVYRRRQY
ncbi:hypothetical protein GHT06_013950 [Daphnia sinensis]|uniref:Uncharacterized protein n=1 Tax=Daphnia sinensis TaxID=1820382 RepID=A0AAD5LCY1_9CRUS|nr:hypothetical protein GHT06_013950 [Daphnia sinensis]